MLISASTNIGSRCVNADAYDGSIFTEHSAERTSYFAVCDGVGEQIGRVASQRAIAGLRAAWEEPQASPIFHSSCEGKLGIALE